MHSGHGHRHQHNWFLEVESGRTRGDTTEQRCPGLASLARQSEERRVRGREQGGLASVISSMALEQGVVPASGWNISC